MATGFKMMTEEGFWGHPPLPGWLPEQRHVRLFIDLETLNLELTKILTSNMKVTHSFISQHFDLKGLLFSPTSDVSGSWLIYLQMKPTKFSITFIQWLWIFFSLFYLFLLCLGKAWPSKIRPHLLFLQWSIEPSIGYYFSPRLSHLETKGQTDVVWWQPIIMLFKHLI